MLPKRIATRIGNGTSTYLDILERFRQSFVNVIG
jgi:hypothetical protein